MGVDITASESQLIQYSGSSLVVLDSRLVNLTAVAYPTRTFCLAAGSNGDLGEWSSVSSVLARPTAASLSPSSGATSGSTEVTVDGSGFVSGVTTVSFGTTATPQASVISPEQLTVTAPAALTGTTTSARVDVTVATSAGSSRTSATDGFLQVSACSHGPWAPYCICDTGVGNPSGLAGPDAQCNGKTLGSSGIVTVQISGVGGFRTTRSFGGSDPAIEPGATNLTEGDLAGMDPSSTTGIEIQPAYAVKPSPLTSVGNPATPTMDHGYDNIEPNMIAGGVNVTAAVELYHFASTAGTIVDVQGWYVTLHR